VRLENVGIMANTREHIDNKGSLANVPLTKCDYYIVILQKLCYP